MDWEPGRGHAVNAMLEEKGRTNPFVPPREGPTHKCTAQQADKIHKTLSTLMIRSKWTWVNQSFVSMVMSRCTYPQHALKTAENMTTSSSTGCSLRQVTHYLEENATFRSPTVQSLNETKLSTGVL